uniref:Uncharacterized protein n=1 Tax=Anguilla anguilla TaxID=7936 RepID=A0A0E9UXZ4_ANGAN
MREVHFQLYYTSTFLFVLFFPLPPHFKVSCSPLTD